VTDVNYTNYTETVDIPSSNELQALVFAISTTESFASVLYRKGHFSDVTTGYLGIIIPKGFEYQYHSSTITQKNNNIGDVVFFIESGLLSYRNYIIVDNSPWDYKVIYSHDHDALVLFLRDTLRTYSNTGKILYGTPGLHHIRPSLLPSPNSRYDPIHVIHTIDVLPIVPGKVGYLAILGSDYNGSLSKPFVNGTFDYEIVAANSTFIFYDTSFKNFVLLSVPVPSGLKMIGNQGIVDIYGPNNTKY
ncbi:hypothetical protein ACR3K2_39210, partial [Cryptosporidium serpentis]